MSKFLFLGSLICGVSYFVILSFTINLILEMIKLVN